MKKVFTLMLLIVMVTAIITGIHKKIPQTSRKPQTVTITTPKVGATFTAPTNMAFGDIDYGTDNSITHVEFAVDGKPFPITHSKPNPRANLNPVIILTAPVNKKELNPPASFTIYATDKENDRLITHVDFYSNDELIATDCTEPFSYVVTNLGSGDYELYAVAYDNNNAIKQSNKVKITILGKDDDHDGVNNDWDCRPMDSTRWLLQDFYPDIDQDNLPDSAESKNSCVGLPKTYPQTTTINGPPFDQCLGNAANDCK